MATTVKIPRYRIFDGRRYERIGSDPGSKKSQDSWADFNRSVNKLRVRVVKISPGKYLAYVARR